MTCVDQCVVHAATARAAAAGGGGRATREHPITDDERTRQWGSVWLLLAHTLVRASQKKPPQHKQGRANMFSRLRAILFDWNYFKTLVLLVLCAEAAFGALLIFHPRLSRACAPGETPHPPLAPARPTPFPPAHPPSLRRPLPL